MTKSKSTVDIMHGKERTPTGQITSPILVAQHLRVTFCTKERLMEHVDTKINQVVVVMHLNDDQVSRPETIPNVSAFGKGIISCFSFLFLG
jgi:hypothetical protein